MTRLWRKLIGFERTGTRWGRLASVLLAIMLLGMASAPVLAACRDPDPPPLPLVLTGQVFETPLRIGRTVLHFVVDTGAARSVIDREAARRLHLVPDPRHRSVIIGVGGRGAAVADVVVPDAALGSNALGALRLAVGDLSTPSTGKRRRDGILGADLFAAHDVDFDFPARRMTFYDPGCFPGGPPWQRVGRPLTARQADGLILTPVGLDGRDFEALIDTGASSTVVSHATALLAGLSAADLKRDDGGFGQGAAGGRVNFRLHRFGRMTIGPDVLRHPLVAVVPTLPVGDALLGLDYLRGRRLWISGASGRIVVSDSPPR